MNEYTIHRLDGLEPDNLLAFIALLGLLRVLEDAQPSWYPRTFWTVNDPILRPALRVPKGIDQAAVVAAAAKGLNVLARVHEFGGLQDLTLSPKDSARSLRKAVDGENRNQHAADLWSALVSDKAMTRDGKRVERTPLCLVSGQGGQHFLSRLTSVPRMKTPPDRGTGRRKTAISETDCLSEALFAPWERPDDTESFRWDPNEDVRHALRARNPSDAKETTQHGANRLAAVGIAALTVAPMRRYGDVRLAVLGGYRETRGGFAFAWPIWREPVSLAGIRALLSHPRLNDRDSHDSLGVVEVRRARRISTGRYMNFTRAEAELNR